MKALTVVEIKDLVHSEAQREADYLAATAGYEEKLDNHPHATPREWEYLRQIIAYAMHLTDQTHGVTQESARLYRALQRARVELGNPPEAH